MLARRKWHRIQLLWQPFGNKREQLNTPALSPQESKLSFISLMLIGHATLRRSIE